jgi:hypothetical protein
MGPVEWEQVPQDDLNEFLADIFSETQTVVESIPGPAPKEASNSGGRARSKTESAASAPEAKRALTLRQKAEAISQAQNLQKEWKEIKVNAKENPLGINVYKLGAKDGRGSWFARRSVHEGLSFDDWKKGLSAEFSETMKVQGAPGSGNIRGIGADKRVEDKTIGDHGQLQGKSSHTICTQMLRRLTPNSLSTLCSIPGSDRPARLCDSAFDFRDLRNPWSGNPPSSTVHDSIKTVRAPRMPSSPGHYPWLLRIS